MILLVDNSIDGNGASPREISKALSVIAPDTPIVRERFDRVSTEYVNNLSPSCIVLSGQSHPWQYYSAASLDPIFSVIRNSSIPILGVCGGHQQIALAFDAKVNLMERLVEGDGYEGNKRERGFFDIDVVESELFTNLPTRFTVWHSHYEEVKELPEDFRCTATNDTCQIQAMQHNRRPLFGVQFHPELFDEGHPLGRTVVENFLALNP